MIAHEVRDKRNNILSGNRFFKIYFTFEACSSPL